MKRLNGSIIFQIIPILALSFMWSQTSLTSMMMIKLTNEYGQSLQKKILEKSVNVHYKDKISKLVYFEDCNQSEINDRMEIIRNDTYQLGVFKCENPTMINFILETINTSKTN